MSWLLPAAVAGTARGLLPVPTQQLAHFGGCRMFLHENLSAAAQVSEPRDFRFLGSTAFVVGVLTLTPIHGAPPRWGIHSYPSPLDGRLEANKSKRGLERSQGPSPSPRLLSPKTATWPVWAHDFAITRILLQNVKDICPHISVPRSWREHRASLLATRSKLATCHLVAGSLGEWNGSTIATSPPAILELRNRSRVRSHWIWDPSVETGPGLRLGQDQDLSTSLLVKTRNLTHNRTFIFFTPWPTRRYAYALVVCFPKVTPSSPSGRLTYPPQLLLRALLGPDEGLDE